MDAIHWIAHKINNVLRGIRAQKNLLRRRFKETRLLDKLLNFHENTKRYSSVAKDFPLEVTFG